MTVKKSPPAERAENCGNTHEKPAAGLSPTERYVEQLLRMSGSYAMPAAEARNILDKETASLTDALYDMRRDSVK